MPAIVADGQWMAAWLRMLADRVERADGSVVLRVVALNAEQVDVTHSGDIFRQYALTGKWTATLEIEGWGGFEPPGAPALHPPRLRGK